MLRPLSVGEILDAGIKVVVRNWKTLLGATLVLMAPIAVVYVLAVASIDPEQLELVPENTQSDPELPEASVFIGLGVTYLLGLSALLIAFGACYKIVSDSWLGRRAEVRETIRYGLQRAPRVFALGLVLFLFTLVAWIPCCIPLVWLGVAWSLAFPALLFERIGPFKALGRSYRLTQGRWWATLGLLVVAYLLVTVISGLVQLPLAVIAEVVAGENAWANGLAQGIGSTVGFVITYPYVIAILTILYFDQRVRKEGFDLQLMAEGLGVEPDPSAAMAAPYVAPRPSAPRPSAPQPAEPEPSEPRPWTSPTGWTAPTPPQEPSLWSPPERRDDRPPEEPPRDDRPPEESPWMTPSPEPPPERGSGDDEPPEWPPRERPRGPGGL